MTFNNGIGTGSTDRYRKPGSVQECRLRFVQWALSQGLRVSLHDEVIAWRVRGEFSPDAMARAVHRTWARHDALTATYHFDVFGESPAQLLRTDVPPEVQITDVGAEPDVSAAARDLVRRQSGERRPLAAAPQLTARIIRATATDHVVSICHPSMMMDHWGYDVFVRDLAAVYTELAGGPAADLEECNPYADFADQEYESLRDGSWAESVDYWRDSYRGESPHPDLRVVGWNGDTSGGALSGGLVTGTFSPDTVALLRSAWAERADRGVTPYSFMLSVVITLLHRLTGEADLGVFVPAANRDQWEYHDTVGLFATILAPRFRDVAGMTFDELGELVRDTLAATMAHQRVTYHDMTRRLDPTRYARPLRTPSCYFDYWIDDQDESLPVFGGATAEPFRLDLPPIEQEGLAFNLYDDRTTVNYSLSHSRRLFDEPAARALAGDLERLAVAAAKAPDSSVAALAARSSLVVPAAHPQGRPI